MATTTVSVKPATMSKINWTQAVSFLAMVLAMFGIDMDEDTRNALLALIVSGQAVVTWVLRTWFTTAVTPSSVNK